MHGSMQVCCQCCCHHVLLLLTGLRSFHVLAQDKEEHYMVRGDCTWSHDLQAQAMQVQGLLMAAHQAQAAAHLAQTCWHHYQQLHRHLD